MLSPAAVPGSSDVDLGFTGICVRGTGRDRKIISRLSLDHATLRPNRGDDWNTTVTSLKFLAPSTSFSNSLRLCRALPSAKALDSVVAPFGVRLLGFFAGAVAVPAEDRLVPRRAVAELSTVR